MLIDTHCHLEEKDYDNLDSLIEKILKSDVNTLIVSGYDVQSSTNALDLAHKYPNIYATVGFHPHDSETIEERDFDLFNEWLDDDKVVGVGEIGLDYYYDGKDKKEQIELFKRQIEIAIKHNKPIVVHNRDASEDIYNILKEYNTKGVIHCFNDDIVMAKKFIDLGFLLGIGGIITFKNNHIKKVIADIPIEYIVLETDSPYLTPEPFRGEKNSPLNLPLVASAIAENKNITYSKVVSTTSANAKHLFDFIRGL